MIYRVSYSSLDGHWGYSYHGSKRAAEAARRAYLEEDLSREPEAEIGSFKTPRTKREVLDLLFMCASHNDNG